MQYTFKHGCDERNHSSMSLSVKINAWFYWIEFYCPKNGLLGVQLRMPNLIQMQATIGTTFCFSFNLLYLPNEKCKPTTFVSIRPGSRLFNIKLYRVNNTAVIDSNKMYFQKSSSPYHWQKHKLFAWGYSEYNSMI